MLALHSVGLYLCVQGTEKVVQALDGLHVTSQAARECCLMARYTQSTHRMMDSISVMLDHVLDKMCVCVCVEGGGGEGGSCMKPGTC
jgi:hypothetical protein